MPHRSLFQYQAKAQPVLPPVPSAAGWLKELSRPNLSVAVRAVAAVAIMASGAFVPPPQPPTNTVAGWQRPLSLPTPPLPGLGAYLQKSYTADTVYLPAASTLFPTWFAGLSTPTPPKFGLGVSLQRDLAYAYFVAPAEVVTMDKWYRPLSEHLYPKDGLRADLQLALTIDPSLIPNPSSYIQGWYRELERSLWEVKGLLPAIQRPYWAPPDTPVSTTKTLTLYAVESGDTAIFAVRTIGVPSVGPAVSALVSIKEVGSGGDPFSIREI